MRHFELVQVPQGRTEAPLALDMTASAGATTPIRAPQRDSIKLVGSADFYRPHS
jgi:hypothetical protein